MSTILLDGFSGQQYRLGKPLNKGGGEGELYKLEGFPDYVAKLYKDDKGGAFRENKLQKMLQSPPVYQGAGAIIWPADILYNQNGCCGFVMPLANDSGNLTCIDSELSASMVNRLIMSRNICRIVKSVHEAGHFIGDFNPLNFLFNQDGHILLVDTDSLCIDPAGTNYQYPCIAQTKEFLAPELLFYLRKYNIVSVDELRTRYSLPAYMRQTDLYSMAIYIFKFLMNGYHPFVCSADSTVSKRTLEQNVIEGYSPYFFRLEHYDIPVSGAFPLQMLPPDIQKLFHRAFFMKDFQNIHRPEPEEFMAAIEMFANMLKRCPKGHEYYMGYIAECPWCIAESLWSDNAHDILGNLLSPPAAMKTASGLPNSLQPVVKKKPAQAGNAAAAAPPSAPLYAPAKQQAPSQPAASYWKQYKNAAPNNSIHNPHPNLPNTQGGAEPKQRNNYRAASLISFAFFAFWLAVYYYISGGKFSYLFDMELQPEVLFLTFGWLTWPAQSFLITSILSAIKRTKSVYAMQNAAYDMKPLLILISILLHFLQYGIYSNDWWAAFLNGLLFWVATFVCSAVIGLLSRVISPIKCRRHKWKK